MTCKEARAGDLPALHSLTITWYVTILVNLRYHPTMSSGKTSRIFGETPEDESALEDATGSNISETESTLLKTVGWISAGLGAVALGLFVGRELRQRYKFNRRTPYDFYAHSGDEQDVDFGLGV
jgi:hypothetical protein